MALSRQMEVAMFDQAIEEHEAHLRALKAAKKLAAALSHKAQVEVVENTYDQPVIISHRDAAPRFVVNVNRLKPTDADNLARTVKDASSWRWLDVLLEKLAKGEPLAADFDRDIDGYGRAVPKGVEDIIHRHFPDASIAYEVE